MKKNAIIIFLAISLISCDLFHDPSKTINKLTIFILLDAARADRFSCYGYDKPTTPRMDEIARKGVLFKRHYAQGFATMVSMPNIFMGRYYTKSIMEIQDIPRRFSNYPFLEDDRHTYSFVRALKNSGYGSYLISAHPWITKNSKITDGFNELISVPSDRGYPPAEKVIDATIKTIKKSRSENLFIYIHLMDTHFPHVIKKEHDLFTKDPSSIRNDNNFINGAPSRMKTIIGQPTFYIGNLPQKSIANMNVLYDGDLRYVDSQIGRLEDYIKKTGLEDRCIYIITADHGEELGEYGLWSHGPFYKDAGQHVPLLIKGPHIKPGVVEGFTEHVDIAPTLITLLGANKIAGQELDGVNLTSELKKKNDSTKDHVFFTQKAFTGVRNSTGLLVRYLNLGIEHYEDYGSDDPLSNRRLMEQLLDKEIAPKRASFISRELSPPNIPFLVYFVEDIIVTPAENFIPWNPHQKKWGPSYLEEGYGTDNKWFFSLHGLFADGRTEKTQPVNLNVIVPNGEYNLFVIAGKVASGDGSYSPIAFKFRAEGEEKWKNANSEKPDSLPPEYSDLKSLQFSESVYISAGVVRINDGVLDFELSTMDGFPAYICGFLFIPQQIKGISGKTTEEDLRAREERTKKLRALGYLD